MTRAQLEALRPELDKWNQRIILARREYAAHPTVTCIGTRWEDDEETPCWNLAAINYGDDDGLCRHCKAMRRWEAAERVAAGQAVSHG